MSCSHSTNNTLTLQNLNYSTPTVMTSKINGHDQWFHNVIMCYFACAWLCVILLVHEQWIPGPIRAWGQARNTACMLSYYWVLYALSFCLIKSNPLRITISCTCQEYMIRSHCSLSLQTLHSWHSGIGQIPQPQQAVTFPLTTPPPMTLMAAIAVAHPHIDQWRWLA